MKKDQRNGILKKSASNDFELKNILTKVIDEEAELSDQEIEFLASQFREKFGFSSGIALNPLLLLEDIEIGEATVIKEEEFDEWEHQDILNVFDNKQSSLENIGIEFLCQEPKQCESFKAKPYACRCIRENFDSPEQFRKWRDIKIEELSSKLTNFIHKK